MTAVRTGPESATTETVIDGLVRAWNEGDANGFAGFFTENADLVNIHGMHLKGRQAIAGLYEMLFRSVFAESNVKPWTFTRRKVHEDVEVVHVKVKFQVQHGHMAGDQDIVVGMLMTRQGNRWMIAAIHNTLVTESRY